MTDDRSLTKERMLEALSSLDEHLKSPLKLVIGGGGAMILAHSFPLSTMDIDAIPLKQEFAEIDPLVKKIAKEIGLAPDWLNPWFASFAYTIPGDYEKRLLKVFSGKHLEVVALSKDDLLIQKCFAARQKDIGHARALIKKGANLEFVRRHLEQLAEKKVPRTEDALDFLDELEDNL